MASTSDVAAERPPLDEHPNGRGVARLRTMWRLFRQEREEPAPFYRALAAESAIDLDRTDDVLGALRELEEETSPTSVGRRFFLPRLDSSSTALLMLARAAYRTNR